MSTNFDFLVDVDISGVQQGGDVKNFTTALIVFDGVYGGVDVFESADDVASSTYTGDQKAILDLALKQSGVSRILAAEVGAGTTLQDVLDDNEAWFAVVFADEDSQSSQLFSDVKGSDYLLAYGVDTDGDTPPSVDGTYSNIVAFAHDGFTGDGNATDGSLAYKLAAAATVKYLAFDADRRFAQMDWQGLEGVHPSGYNATQRTALIDAGYNTYGVVQGRPSVQEGLTTQGLPVNVVVTRMWLNARIKEQIANTVYTVVNQYGGLQYDNAGIGTVVGAVMQVLDRGEKIGHLVREYSTVDAPTLAEVSEQDLRDGLLYIEVNAVQKWRMHRFEVRGAVRPTIGEVA